jgi:hypothetical protein
VQLNTSASSAFEEARRLNSCSHILRFNLVVRAVQVSAGRIEFSVASLRKVRPGLLGLNARRTWRTSTIRELLKVERGQSTRKISEGVRRTQLRRDSSLQALWGQTQEGREQNRSLEAGRVLQRKRIDDFESSWRITKPRGSSDQGEGARGLTLEGAGRNH